MRSAEEGLTVPRSVVTPGPEIPGDLTGAPPDRPGPTLRQPWLVVVAAVVALGLTAFVFYHWGSAKAPVAAAAPTPTPTASKAPTTASIYTSVAPSIVSVEALAADGKTVKDTGTGVIVNGDGTIMTALHVVNGAGAVRVVFADGTPSDATVTATDPTSDIATLGPTTLPSVVVPAVLGNAGRLAVGDDVIAIGNPLGLTRTTTTGVVSGLDRRAPGPEGVGLTGLIQFDAAVNPGSSGGPLLNAKGETVGIVVALVNPTTAGTFIGIGFAVPIGTAVTAPGDGRVPQQ